MKKLEIYDPAAHLDTTLEASNLQEDLRRAGIEPWGWIVNQSLAAAKPASGLLRQRARQEYSQLSAIEQQHAKHLAVVPVQENEPVGLPRLKVLFEPTSQTGSEK